MFLSKKLKIVLIIVLILVIFIFTFVFLGTNKKIGGYPEIVYVKVGNAEVYPVLATSTYMQMLGLSTKKMIQNDEGMIFEIQNPDIQAIWMKEMKFSLDIIWIDANNKVVHVKENLTPASYPEIYSATVPTKYVLEVKDGFVKKNNIKIGDKLYIKRR